MYAGPGRPVIAARKAARIISGSRSHCRTVAAYLVIGRAMFSVSAACHAPPRFGSVLIRARVVAIATSGWPSPWALTTPASMLPVPHAGFPRTTPGFRAMRA